ncbi:hypothetical protein D6817_04605 [Candidatus Pacearchaeota archaeon]|nr:MAG: hypothetical protein D6817_04605 [Candidatus Pacearchaeota archaeon]
MARVSLRRITRKGRALYLAYDQGLEHGPESDFNERNADPRFIIEIARKGKFSGVVFQRGIAEKYFEELQKAKVPLILKLNGKTKLPKGEPISAQIADVGDAVRLRAAAVGFTIYIGSEHEAKMLEQFASIQREAHRRGLLVIAWIYPRGKGVKNDVSREMIAYAARVGLEAGADIVKLKYGGNEKDLAWAVRAAGKTKVVVAGGTKKDEKSFLKQVREIVDAGAIGLAVGRNVWQHERPLEIARKLREIIFGEK